MAYAAGFPAAGKAKKIRGGVGICRHLPRIGLTQSEISRSNDKRRLGHVDDLVVLLHAYSIKREWRVSVTATVLKSIREQLELVDKPPHWRLSASVVKAATRAFSRLRSGPFQAG